MPTRSHQKPASTPPKSIEGKHTRPLLSKRPSALTRNIIHAVSPTLMARLSSIKWFGVDIHPGSIKDSPTLEARLKAAVAFQKAAKKGQMTLGDPYPGTAVDTLEPYIESLFVYEKPVRNDTDSL